MSPQFPQLRHLRYCPSHFSTNSCENIALGSDPKDCSAQSVLNKRTTQLRGPIQTSCDVHHEFSFRVFAISTVGERTETVKNSERRIAGKLVHNPAAISALINVVPP